MRFAVALFLSLSVLLPIHGHAAPKPPITVAADGFPAGQDTPEGAAADLARAFIGKDPLAFKNICIRLYSEGESRKNYEAFLEKVVSGITSEKALAAPSPKSPKAIGKIFASRRLTNNGAASYGHASFGFQDIAFVDVAVELHNGQSFLNRTLVIKDRDDKWYAHPAPQVSPLLAFGLNEETPSRTDFSEAYAPKE